MKYITCLLHKDARFRIVRDIDIQYRFNKDKSMPVNLNVSFTVFLMKIEL